MKKIFVVDDEKSILDALEFMLTEEGYLVKTSARGSDLLKLNSDLPDVIILDVLLSGEDGREIARKLKLDYHTRDIPIVMISAHPNARESVKACGADEFISKPFDIDGLLSTVEKHCKKVLN